MVTVTLFTSGFDASADVHGTQQTHTGSGVRFAYQWNIYGLRGAQAGTTNPAAELGGLIAQDLYYNWSMGAPIFGLAVQEACAEHLWAVAVSLAYLGLPVYQNVFNRTLTPVKNGNPRTDCTQFGNFALALGNPVAFSRDLPFSAQSAGQNRSIPGQEQRGIGCIAARFMGVDHIVCSTHLVHGSHAMTRVYQMNEALASVHGTSPLILGLDANAIPSEAALDSPSIFGYTEVDAACAGVPSCVTAYTHSVISSVATWNRKYDYIFVRGYNPIPRSFVFALPSWSDHAQVYGYA